MSMFLLLTSVIISKVVKIFVEIFEFRDTKIYHWSVVVYVFAFNS